VRPQRRWRLKESPLTGALNATPYPLLIQRLLENRGVATPAAARAFLDGGLEIDPSALPDIDKAVAVLTKAVQAGDTIAVFGDFDVDGITAAAILSEGLTSLGAGVLTHIPDRFREGYGLNKPAIDRLRERGAGILLAVDCGISSLDEVAHARSLGMEVVVVDHHLPLTELPVAQAIVNPKLASPPIPAADLASAGLAYLLVQALHDSLRRPFPRERYLDLAALGTVVDMAPLLGPNRELVRRGLAALTQTERPGLQALMTVARVDVAAAGTEALSFALGPRLNAAGRIAHGRLSYELLTCREPEAALSLARDLDALNRERQRQTLTALDLARSLLAEDDGALPLIMVGHGDIPAGVAGLVASRLAEEMYRPAVVYSEDGGLSRASARSIPEFDIAAALRECCDLFVRFGGHHQAAGFTAENERLPAIKERLVACASERLAGAELTPVIDIDAEMPLRSVGSEEIRWLARLAPHGMGNPEPLFLSRGVQVLDCRTLGSDGQHLWLKLRDGAVVWPAIAFGLGEVEVGETADLVYSVGVDPRENGALQLVVRDLAPHQGNP